MACAWCAHWYRVIDLESDDRVKFYEDQGECRLHPTIRTKYGYDGCGQFTFQQDRNYGAYGRYHWSVLASYCAHIDRLTKENHGLKKEVKRLKAVSKDLRTKLKAGASGDSGVKNA